MEYIALIHKEAESDFGVSFPDLPGCITAGHNLDEAREFATEALALHIDGLIEDGEELPEASSLEEIMSDPDNHKGVAILVHAPATQVKAVRLNITLAENVLAEIDRYAEIRGLTRSGFLCLAARDVMKREPA